MNKKPIETINIEKGLEIADEVVFLKVGKRLSPVEIAIFKGSWLRQTYEEIAKVTNYSVSYLKQHVGPELWKVLTEALGEEVNKTNFRSCLERKWRSSYGSALMYTNEEGKRYFPEVRGIEGQEEHTSTPAGKQASTGIGENEPPDLILSPYSTPQCDWGEAVDVSMFCGRVEELKTLEQWIMTNRCRLISVLGMGGVGKTFLTLKLATQVQQQFDAVIWRSLKYAPPLENLLAELISFLSNQQESKGEIGRLIHYLRTSRCLVILDNVESILEPGQLGQFRPSHSRYDELLQVIGDAAHQSCLILTSREKPDLIAANEGVKLPVRSIRLGESPEAAQALLAAKGLVGSQAQKQELCDRYSNNPLALKIAATSIQDLFNGKISEFLHQKTLVFNGIRLLLEQQFNRLSPQEKSIMYWLAINQQETTLAELESDIVPAMSWLKLLEALEGLWRYSVIEKHSSSYTQKPMMMEYVTQRFVEEILEEIATEKPKLLLSHTLIKTTTKDNIRENQFRLILKPIVHRLHTTFQSEKNIESKLSQIVAKLQQREELSVSIGYLNENIINLLEVYRSTWKNEKIYTCSKRRFHRSGTKNGTKTVILAM